MIIAVMIVKNESHVIERCLKSLIAHVDGVFILDTGSEIGQFDTMRAKVDILCAGVLPVAIQRSDWKGFAGSRNEALDLAVSGFQMKPSDYLFMIDADDYVTHWNFTGGGQPGYTVVMESEAVTYERIQLFRVSACWRYFGVVHEYPKWTMPDCEGRGVADVRVVSTRDGARSHDPQRYVKDAQAIAHELSNEKLLPDDVSRYQFYLAQSWRDAGHRDLACDAYLKRAENANGWIEERYVSYLNLIRMSYEDHYRRQPEAIRAGVMKAQALCPDRREAVCALMMAYREAEQYAEVISLFDQFPPTELYRGGLFMEPNAYTFTMFDELAIACHYTGDHLRSVRASAIALLKHPQSQGDIARLHTNLEFAVKALAERASNGTGTSN